MSEITKLYENAGIEKIAIIDNECPVACSVALDFKYPSFTSEKQIAILKLLTINRGILIKRNVFFTNIENPENIIGTENIDSNFEEGFASLINILWRNLTQSEQKQIKEILE